MAIGAILAARDLGLGVPHDVSVIGVDDHELADFFGLSTVAQFPRDQGRRAATMILEDLTRGDQASGSGSRGGRGNGWGGGRDVRVPYELVVRSSTARPATL
jgi:DNA-binding LacI/PurR family transcriptional regulator